MEFDSNKLVHKISRILKIEGLKVEDIRPMQSGGLTHDHYTIGKTNWLLRVPRRNQLDMTPEDYLEHQRHCYEAAEPSGVTPRFGGIIRPSADLPNGVLIVERIDGRRPSNEKDWIAMGTALAALNSLTPASDGRLSTATAPFESQWFVVHDIFGRYLDAPGVDEKTRSLLKSEKDDIRKALDALAKDTKLPVGMIGGDSHLGNFLIDRNGKARFVDLEFLTFDVPHLDAADAASEMTARLDPGNKLKADQKSRSAFYQAWSAASGFGHHQKHAEMMKLSERIVQLRTLAWLCYWVDEGRAKQQVPEASRANWDQMAEEYLKPDVVAGLLGARHSKPFGSFHTTQKRHPK